MALIRRSGARFSANIWPGFVDAMTAILLVLMFVLSIFMIVQSILRDTITGQNSALQDLNLELKQVKDHLNYEKLKLGQLNTQYQEKLIALDNIEQKLSSQQLRNYNLGEELKEKNVKLDSAQLNLRNLNLEIGLIKEQLESKTEEFTVLDDKHISLTEKYLDLTATADERLALLSALRTKFNLSEGRVEAAEAKIANLIAKKLNLESKLKSSSDQFQGQVQRNEILKLALVNSRNEVNKSVEEARLNAAKTEALEILIGNLKLEQDALNRENEQTADSLKKSQVQLIDRDNQLSEITIELEQNKKNLILERAAILALEKRLALESEELGLITLALEAERKKAIETLQLLAGARAIRASLEEKNRELGAENLSAEKELELKKIALREARAQLLQEKELTKASAQEVNRLNVASDALSKKLNDLQKILDESELKDEQNNVQIKVLGSRLNAALARVASEQRKRAEIEARESERLRKEANDLKNYRSEFFGKLRSILGKKVGIEVVGDRFVFDSEVLFEPGSAILGEDGRRQLSKVAKVVRDISKDIPKSLNWILRVDGHTDIIPLAKSSKFADNWELSQARALSVVKFLIKFEGINAKRLAAAGFGEFQPLSNDSSPRSLARNRRIELKLTEK